MTEPSLVSISDALDTLRSRPSMYLGARSVTRLRVFLDAFGFLHLDGKIRLSTGTPDFGQFSNWVSMKYGCIGSVEGWDGVLLRISSGDEAKALATFLQDLDEFRKLDPDVQIPGPDSALSR